MVDDRDKASGDARTPVPGDAEIRAQVERILASECFAQTVRAAQFLRYVVEETIAGRGERLKGYTIAMEVFERSADFDPQTDPLVRVEAGRLRRRLIEYYAVEGRNDPVVIELPRGTYAVTCSYAARDRVQAAATDTTPVQAAALTQPSASRRDGERRRRQRRTFIAVAALALALVVIGRDLLAPTASSDATTAALASGGSARITVVPFQALDGDEASRTLGATLTEELLLELDEHELFVPAIEPTGGALPAAVATSAPQYLLTGSVRSTQGRMRITARLVAASTGLQLWTTAYDEPLEISASPNDQTRVVRAIAAVSAPYGPVFEAERMRIATLAPEQLRTSDCVLKYYEYRSIPSPALHGEVWRCFQRAVQTAPELANSWAGLSLLLLDVGTFGYGLDEISVADAREQAGEAARRAMDIDGKSLLANLAFARMLFFSQDGFQRAADRALELCPNNMEALHIVGSMWVLAGDNDRGLAMVDRAIALAPNAPGSYYAVQALGLIRRRDYEGAVAAALRIDAPDWHLGYLVLAATAGLAGRTEVAARAYARLRELYPTIDQDLPDVLRRFRAVPELQDEVRRGLGAASAQLG
jgi:adenylate cyclase